MRAIILFACMALSGLLCGQPARAGQPVVVELFTSQGCSSCPPADRFLAELGDHADVIPLALHVDYWDYLGWTDTFASAANTARQRAYAPKVDRQWLGRRLRGAFTPEIVVQGSDSLIGSSRSAVLARIAAHAEKPPIARIGLARQGDEIVVTLAPTGHALPTTAIMVAEYVPARTVEVRRGENAGKSITYTHIVTRLSSAGEWDGRREVSLKLPGIVGPVAVFLQQGRAGPIVAAAALKE